jgi:hypothetical protein
MKNSDQSRNQSYENMRDVKPGDRVFSYASQRIGAVGFVVSEAIVAAKPTSFGHAGEAWSREGWLVAVRFTNVEHPLSPRAHLDAIVPLLPAKYSPIRADGRGNQGIYLASISSRLGDVLAELIGMGPLPGHDVDGTNDDVAADVREVLSDPSVADTEKQQLINARVGQGLFRAEVLKLEPSCRVTHTSDPAFLRASHIKPWRLSSNAERLDGANGLALAPHIDLLFDRGFITFADDGALLTSNRLPIQILQAWDVRLKKEARPLSAIQARYMRHHRDEIFRKD